MNCVDDPATRRYLNPDSKKEDDRENKKEKEITHLQCWNQVMHEKKVQRYFSRTMISRY